MAVNQVGLIERSINAQGGRGFHGATADVQLKRAASQRRGDKIFNRGEGGSSRAGAIVVCPSNASNGGVGERHVYGGEIGDAERAQHPDVHI